MAPAPLRRRARTPPTRPPTRTYPASADNRRAQPRASAAPPAGARADAAAPRSPRPALAAQLRTARGCPAGLAARTLLRRFTPLLRQASRLVEYTPLQRQFQAQVVMACTQRMGPHSHFFTISPSGAHSPLTIRFGARNARPRRGTGGEVVWVEKGMQNLKIL